jgi:hypothetical protein
LDQLLGIVFLAGYIVAIIALAAGITWAVIRIFPTQRNPKKDEKDDKPAKAAANGSGEAQGRLFRRSKRQSS